MTSTVVYNVSATTFVNQPVTVSLSGLIKPDANIKVISGDASAYKQNVTFMPPLDFDGAAVVNCESSDGNKIIISIMVVKKPIGDRAAEVKVRTQVRTTTMSGDPVEDRFWTVTEDTGVIEGPMAAFVPLQVQKVTALEFVEGHPPEDVLTPSSNFFASEVPGSWIVFDLGHISNISEIDITWRSPCDFSLAISKDRKSFINVYQGRGVGISAIKMPGVEASLLKITAISNKIEINFVQIKGSPINPKPTSTGAQALLTHSSQIVQPGQLVVMDGSLSKGDIIRYVWENPSGSLITLFNEKTSIASFVAPEVEVPTTFQFTLTVVDRNGQYSKAESLIHIGTGPKVGLIPPPKTKDLSELDSLTVIEDDTKYKEGLSKLDKFYKENPCCKTEKEEGEFEI